MPVWGQEKLASLLGFSHTLWGNQDRLVVAVAVAEAEPGELYSEQLAETIGILPNRVGPSLKRFETKGLLVRMPKVGGDRRVYYERRNAAFWEGVLTMGEALSADLG